MLQWRGFASQERGRNRLSADDLGRELEVAIQLARRAGEAILRRYGQDLLVEHKADAEPVTEADLVADDLIRAGLRAAFPGDGLLTEESADDLSRLEKERVWIVDPLDGTTEFIAQTGEFVVQIALTVGGRPVLGVVLQPTTQQLYYACAGQGAYRLSGGVTRRLHVSQVSEPAQAHLVASRAHYSALVEEVGQRLGIRSVERVGSVGLKVGRVAEGVCDLYLTTGVSREWDICAPHVVLQEAGGVLTDLCGQPLVYNQGEVMACRGLVGSNGRLHGLVVDAVAVLRGAGEAEASWRSG